MMPNAYVYRLIDDGKEIGIAIASSLEYLFWMLDEFASPYDYEFSLALPGDALSNSYKIDNSTSVNFDATYIEESDQHPSGEYISEGLRNLTEDRVWLRFKMPHDNTYETIVVE